MRYKTLKTLLMCILVILIVGLGYIIGRPYVEKMIYPLAYEETILKYAEQYDLDPYFVAAIINTESSFDPESVSARGAIGLMQIMPETGQWIADKIGMEDFQESQLTDPEVNIQMGCWYLHFLWEMFDGNIENIAASYNAGQNRVKDWLTDPEISKDGENLHDIPYEETHNYVNKVKEAYEKYQELYDISLSK